jgi:hypothetical protein
MKIPGYVLIAVLVLLLAIAAGCTTPQQTPAATQAPATAAQQTYSAPAAPRATSGADIDTTVNVRVNELSCINVQDLLGSDYLYPDQQFKLEAAPPSGANTVNVNVLFVDENNQLKLRETEPKWDGVHNTWVYDGVVPVVKFIAVTIPVEKTFTIKSQSKYYICADDRKESGTNDVVYRVPVKLTRV